MRRATAALGTLALAGILVGAAAAPVAAAEDSLTVLDCARAAMARAPAVLVAGAEAEAARLDARAAARNRLPELALHSGLLAVPPGAYDPAITNLGEYDLKLVATMPLADAGVRRRERLRTGAVAAGARSDLEAAQVDAGQRAAELAVAILAGTARIRRREEASAWTARVIESIRSGVRAGTRSPSDVARLALEQRGLETDLGTDRRDRAAAARELAALLGRAAEEVRVRAQPTSVGPATADSAALLGRADSSAEVRRARSEVGLAAIALADARARRGLQVDLTADAGFAGTDLSHWGPADLEPRGGLGDRLRHDAGASLAFELRRPLVTPGAAATVAAREAGLRAATIRLERAREAARRGAADLLARWSYAAGVLPGLAASVREAGDNLVRAHSLYVAGALPLLELLDARRVLAEAQDREEEVGAELERARAEAALRGTRP